MSSSEQAIAEKLRTTLAAEHVEVLDQSGECLEFCFFSSCVWFNLTLVDVALGGCGEQYAVFVVAEKFRGLSLVQQQRLVNSTLKVPCTHLSQ